MTLNQLLSHGVLSTDHALLTLRCFVGTFFALAGAHKLTVPERRHMLFITLLQTKIPYPRFNVVWVPLVELVGGALLVIGLCAPLAAALLLILMIVAVYVTGRARVAAYNPLDFSDRLDDYLYLQEPCYGLMVFAVMAAGAGKFSLDYLLFG